MSSAKIDRDSIETHESSRFCSWWHVRRFSFHSRSSASCRAAIPRSIDLRTRFSEHIVLNRPIVSANMDTITRSAMAVVLAEEGGIGVIDRGFRAGDIAPQVDGSLGGQADAARRHPRSALGLARISAVSDASRLMRKTGVGTLLVVDQSGRLEGLLTERDVRFVPRRRDRRRANDAARTLVVHTGSISLADAEAIMTTPGRSRSCRS